MSERLTGISVVFYRTEGGTEPVLEWLRSLTAEDRRSIGTDLATVQFGWPIGMPLSQARVATGAREPESGRSRGCHISNSVFAGVASVPHTKRGVAGGQSSAIARARCPGSVDPARADGIMAPGQ
jgi:hypothetical protein